MLKKIIDAVFALFNTQQQKNKFLGDLDRRESLRAEQLVTIAQVRAGLDALHERMRAIQDMIENPF